MALEVPVAEDICDRITATPRPEEAVELSIVDAFLPPTPTTLDVGASVGNHAIYWALTHHSEITAFEPYVPARQLLITNIVRNGVGHSVTTHGQALGAGPGRGVSEPRQGNPGATRLRTAPDENVNASALDSLHAQHPGLLKIDVEENEMAALQGASHAVTELCSIVWFEALATADQTTVWEVMAGHVYPVILILSPTNAILPRRRTGYFGLA